MNKNSCSGCVDRTAFSRGPQTPYSQRVWRSSVYSYPIIWILNISTDGKYLDSVPSPPSAGKTCRKTWSACSVKQLMLWVIYVIIQSVMWAVTVNLRVWCHRQSKSCGKQRKLTPKLRMRRTKQDRTCSIPSLGQLQLFFTDAPSRGQCVSAARCRPSRQTYAQILSVWLESAILPWRFLIRVLNQHWIRSGVERVSFPEPLLSQIAVAALLNIDALWKK